MNAISKLFAKMIRRKFVHTYYRAVKNNQFFMHEGRKYQRLDDTRACTTGYPTTLKFFKPNDIVLAIYY